MPGNSQPARQPASPLFPFRCVEEARLQPNGPQAAWHHSSAVFTGGFSSPADNHGIAGRPSHVSRVQVESGPLCSAPLITVPQTVLEPLGALRRNT